MSLSDKGYEEIFCRKCGNPINGDSWCFTCNCTPINKIIENVFKESYVKQFIKDLKLKIINHTEVSEEENVFCKIIDKLAGDKLI